MGKYTKCEYWPEDLKAAAAEVIRAKMERKWFKSGIRYDKPALYLTNQYIEADARLAVAKARFKDLYRGYQETGIIPRR